MFRRTAFLMIFGVLAVGAVVLGSWPQTGQDLFQKALRLETNEGQWMEAIAVYKTILKKFPDDRELAAEAQFRIGMCYERLGNEEAQSAYQAVIQSYAEQKAVVARAQERLSKMARPAEKPEEPEGIRIQQVLTKPYTDYLGSISADGRFLAHVYWGEGDLAIRDLTTGEDRLLTHEADVNKGFAIAPRFSKDGRRIAYAWWNSGHSFELFLIDVNNPKPLRLLHEEGANAYPVAWLSDHELVYERTDYETWIGRACSLDVSNGTIRELKTFRRGGGLGISCSPDGRFIAYDFPRDTDSGKRDIALLDVQGGTEIPLIEHPADDRVLGWVPGRSELLFISDRSGTWDLWALPMTGEKPSGTEKRVYTDIGEVSLVGFARNGDCFVGFVRRVYNTFVAPFNPETGEIDERSRRAILGTPWNVDWSPNGRFLTYGRNIEDLKTGEKRRFAENLNFTHPVRWSPDGNTILVIGWEKDKFHTEGYKGGVFAVDLRTGDVTEVVALSDLQYAVPGDDAFPLSDVEWSADGKSIFYLLFRDRLVKRDLATRDDTVLYKSAWFDRGVLQRSPDGRRLLLSTPSGEKGKEHLFTIPVEGGKERDVCTHQRIDKAIWTADGRYVYFQDHRGWQTSLWRVAAEGGVPEKMWQSDSRAEIYDIRPDGKEIAMARSESTTEIRVVKNLVRELEKLYKTP